MALNNPGAFSPKNTFGLILLRTYSADTYIQLFITASDPRLTPEVLEVFKDDKPEQGQTLVIKSTPEENRSYNFS